MRNSSNRLFTTVATLLAACLVLAFASSVRSDQVVDEAVLAAEQKRIDTIRQITQPTLSIFDSTGQGGGSGVVISPDGYALTNFHVVAPCGPAMKCGMSDGKIYDAVLVGLDPTGDVALIKLFGRDDFPAAELGDSDSAHVGQWAYVVGNPFMLADDFQPTVTYGIISGVHRYQYPAGTLLEYADCLQTDAAINPGNSGGPLFDADGRLIGVNGRASFEKRGRVNVGVGYAISINQIQRFLGCLKSGRIVDHASLGATVTTDYEGRVVVDDILEESDAYRRGLRYDDEIVRFGDREISTVNAFKNAIGTYPAGWRVPLVFRRDGRQYDRLVTLSGFHREGELAELLSTEAESPQPKPHEGDRPKEDKKDAKPDAAKKLPSMPKLVREHYETRPGFANYWFNRNHQDRVWDAYRTRCEMPVDGAAWTIRGRDENGQDVWIELDAQQGRILNAAGESRADFDGPLDHALSPAQSGGLLQVIHTWQRLAAVGLPRFGEVYYFGILPWPGQNSLADCLVGIYGGVETRFYFEPKTGDLIGLELQSAEDEDTCRIVFSDIRMTEGSYLPYRWEVLHGDDLFMNLDVDSYEWRRAEN